MKGFLWLLMICLMLFATLGVAGEQSKPPQNAKRLKVHVLLFTHLDPSWRHPFETYYTRHVRGIVDNVIRLLELDTSRKFTWEGMSYLHRWYNDAADADRKRLHALIDADRFHISHGGWVSPDEANVDLFGSVMNLQAGYQWVGRTLGVTPRVYLQADPFGASSLSPAVVSKTAANFMMHNRVDWRFKYQTRRWGMNNFIWQGCELLGDQSNLWTHIMYDMYHYPSVLNLRSIKLIRETEAARYAETLSKYVHQMSSAYPTRHVPFMWGFDFAYQTQTLEGARGGGEIVSIQNMIDYIKAHPTQFNFDIDYSHPDEYIQAELSEFDGWNRFNGDLIPYHDRDPVWWSGYYSGRPNLKKAIRLAQHWLRVSDTFGIGYIFGGDDWDSVLSTNTEQRQWISFGQHHDAITGTAKHLARKELREVLANAKTTLENTAGVSLSHLFAKAAGQEGHGPQLTASSKLPTGSSGLTTPIVVFNPLLTSRTEFVSITLPQCEGYTVSLPSGDLVDSQVTCISSTEAYLDFQLQVPGLTTRVVFVSGSSTVETVGGISDVTELTGSRLILKLNDVGCVDSATDIESQESIKIGCNYMDFKASSSGAYTFDPADSGVVIPAVTTTPPKVFNGPLVAYVVTVRDRIKTTVRFVKSAMNFEVTTAMKARDNAEGGIVFQTDLDVVHKLWSDNGWQMRYRPNFQTTHNTAAHQHPLTKAAAIVEAGNGKGLLVSTRQGSGALNLRKGELMVMIQRNIRRDDGKGLQEAPNDQSTHVMPILVTPIFAVSKPVYSECYSVHDGTTSHLDMRPSHYFEHTFTTFFGESVGEILDWKYPAGLQPFDTSGITSNIFPVSIQQDATRGRLGVVLGNSDSEGRFMSELSLTTFLKPLGGISKLSETGINLYSKDKPDLPVPKHDMTVWPMTKCPSSGCPKNAFEIVDHAADPGPQKRNVSPSQTIVDLPSNDIRGFFIDFDSNTFDATRIAVTNFEDPLCPTPTPLDPSTPIPSPSPSPSPSPDPAVPEPDTPSTDPISPSIDADLHVVIEEPIESFAATSRSTNNSSLFFVGGGAILIILFFVKQFQNSRRRTSVLRNA